MGAILTAIGIGAGLASGLAGIGAQYGANASLQHDAQIFNSSEAQKQRDWQNMMSSTAYQRQVADMKAAGLSPALLYAGGASGASSSGGASASSPGASVGMPALNAFTAMMDYINRDRDYDHKLALEREKASSRANALDRKLDAFQALNLSKTDYYNAKTDNERLFYNYHKRER